MNPITLAHCIIHENVCCYCVIITAVFLSYRCPPAVVQLLKNTEKNQIEREGIKATRLYTHTEDVATTNQRELAALPGETRRFMASDSNSSLTEQLNNLCPVPDCVELKKGAQVTIMVACTQSLNYSTTFFNQ